MPELKQNLGRLTRSDLGPLLHVGLRKGCDSRQTTGAWNMIHVLIEHFNEEWGAYLDAVWKALCEQPKLDQHGIAIAVREISTEWWSEPRMTSQSLVLLCLFRMFSADDWFGYTSFLEEEIREDPADATLHH